MRGTFQIPAPGNPGDKLPFSKGDIVLSEKAGK
jgi:hypothetical protein